ncbi:hypothetical protein GCM10010182_04610 [Actinomadura cremea]|nr:hypothetical protein GCM10010182_04610 [Actinomadura cremea]
MIADALVPGRDAQGPIVTALIGAAEHSRAVSRPSNVDGVQGFFDLSAWITAVPRALAIVRATGQPRVARSRGRGSAWGRRWTMSAPAPVQ